MEAATSGPPAAAAPIPAASRPGPRVAPRAGPVLPPGLAPSFSAAPARSRLAPPQGYSLKIFDSRFVLDENTIQTALEENARMITEWSALVAARGGARTPEEESARARAEADLSVRVQSFCRILANLADKIDKVADVSKDDLRTVFPPSALPEHLRAVLYTEAYRREQAGRGGEGVRGEQGGEGGGSEAGAEPGGELAIPAADLAAGAVSHGAGPEGSAAAAASNGSSSDSEGASASAAMEPPRGVGL